MNRITFRFKPDELIPAIYSMQHFKYFYINEFHHITYELEFIRDSLYITKNCKHWIKIY